MKKLGVGLALVLGPLVGLGVLVVFSPALGVMAIVGGGGSEDVSASAAAGGGVPGPYRAVVVQAGSVCEEVSPFVVAAQVEAESAWDAEAESGAGAQGISQFMPSTWAAHGLDGDGDGEADVWNAVDSIWSQGNYMCELVGSVKVLLGEGKVSGDVLSLALAAYNAGLGNVMKHGGVPPFAETRAYVEKITAASVSFMTGGSLPVGGGVNSGAGGALAWAISMSGRPYRGEGPGAFDCCTLVRDAFAATLGVRLPMSTPGLVWRDAKCENAMLIGASSYGGVIVPADVATLQPGDIVFFQSMSVSASVDNVTHVGIWAGDGKLVDAIPGAGVGVRDLSFYRNSEVLLPWAVRVPGAA